MASIEVGNRSTFDESTLGCQTFVQAEPSECLQNNGNVRGNALKARSHLELFDKL